MFEYYDPYRLPLERPQLGERFEWPEPLENEINYDYECDDLKNYFGYFGDIPEDFWNFRDFDAFMV